MGTSEGGIIAASVMRSWTVPLSKITVGRKTAWLPPSMNSGGIGMHWSVRQRWKKAQEEMVFYALKQAGVPKLEKAIVTIRQEAVHLRDHDAIATACKGLLDAIVLAGVLPDDKPECMELRFQSVRVPHRAMEQVVLVVVEA